MYQPQNRISSGAQYVTLQKYFSHPSLVIYFFFATSPTKSKLGKQIGGGLVIASEPPGPIIYGRPIGNNDE
jgi:hypothetical protein